MTTPPRWPEELPPGSTWPDFPHPLMSRMSSSRETVQELLRYLAQGELLIPDYQRSHKWTPQQSAAFVGFALEGAPLPAIYIREVDAPEGFRDELVDGQQRLTALRAFDLGEIPAVFPSTGRCAWKEKLAWTGWRMIGMPVCRFRSTRREAMSLYLAINYEGTPHTADELRRVRELIAKETA